MPAHRWSGWPGAWCLDCGIDDPLECALAEGAWITDYAVLSDGSLLDKSYWRSEEDRVRYTAKDCPEPGSNRHNPYVKRSL